MNDTRNPYLKGNRGQESLDYYKKEAKQIISDFCLGRENTQLLHEKVDRAQSYRDINDILKEARELL